MKTISKTTTALIIIFSAFFTSCNTSYEDKSDFKMVLRLWENAYTHDELREGLISQMEKHPVFDEVWMDIKHIENMDQASRMAETLRAIGVEPGTEQCTIGHLDKDALIKPGQEIPENYDPITNSFVYGDYNDNDVLSTYVYERGMVGHDGKTANSQNCPRSKMFCDSTAAFTAAYAQRLKPARMFLDDDLRIYNHAPVSNGCFCENCIADFNAQTGGSWTRETLVAALGDNRNEDLREAWVKFGEESLAILAGSIARAVHAVSPDTEVALENGPNANIPLTGGMLPSVMDSLYAATGHAPSYRPGGGFYNDWSPRGMIEKANTLARQMRGMPSYVTQTPAEVECYHHTASGKSPEGAAVESMLYLAMGCTELSYHILGSCDEPMEWYGDNFFTVLEKYKPYYQNYVDFNLGTEPGGLDEYLSPTYVRRAPDFFRYISNDSRIIGLQAVGLPFTPGGHYPCAYIMNAADFARCGSLDLEMLSRSGMILDEEAFALALDAGFDGHVAEAGGEATPPEGVRYARFFTTDRGGRIAVLPTITADNFNIRRTTEMFAIADWVSSGKLPVIAEDMAQMAYVPRVDAEGNLRSVLALNCSISDSHPVTLRLRGAQDVSSIIWHTVDEPDRKLTFSGGQNGSEITVTIPSVADWRTGWLSLE